MLPKITDRVVTLSSYAHRIGRINLDELNWEHRRYGGGAPMGALPELYAATVATPRGGEFVGPDGRLDVTGHPKFEESTAASKHKATAAALWQLSERLTGVRYP